MAKGNKIKKFTIDYLQIIEEETIVEETVKSPYDISPFLENISHFPPYKRQISYYDDKIRLELVRKIPQTELSNHLNSNNNLWELRFLRLRKGLLPGIAEDEGNFNENALADSLGSTNALAESISCMYDSTNCLLILERSRELSPSGILEFLSKSMENNNITLAIIPDADKFINLGNNPNLKLVDISLAQVNSLDFKSKFLNKSKLGSFFGAINSLSDFGSASIKLSLSINGNSKGTLSRSNVIDSLENLTSNPYVNKLLVHAKKEDESGNIEKIDLFDSRIKSEGKIEYSHNEPKSHLKVLFELKSHYNNNIININNILIG